MSCVHRRTGRPDEVVVIGAGQAGLAVSHELSELGVDHVVLERMRVGQTWRDLWDSFCLVTPNWTMSLPGFPYPATIPRASSLATRSSGTWNATRRASARPFTKACASTAWSPGRRGGSCCAPRPATWRRSRSSCVRAPFSARTVPMRRPHSRRGRARDRRQGLPEPRSPPAGKGVGDRQRPDRLSDLRGAARGGPRGVSRLRASALGAAAARRPRHRVVAARDHLLRHVGRRAARAVSSPGREPAGDRSSRRPRPALPHVADDGCAAPGSPDRRRGAPRSFRRRPGRLGGVRRRALRRHQGDAQQPARRQGNGSTGAAGSSDVLRRPAAGARPRRLRRRDLHNRLPSRLRALGALPVLDAMGFPLTHDDVSTVVPGLFFCGVHFLRKRKSSTLFGVGEDAAIVAQSIARNRSEPAATG